MFYKQNIAAIALKNETLAQELSQMFLILAQENIEVYSAETGDYVFSYEGLALDDMVNPKEDAALNFAENVPADFSAEDVVILFGLGTGYLLDYIAQNTKSKIILFEPKTDIFRYCAEFIDMTSYFALENLSLAKSEAEVISLLKKLYIPNKTQVKVIYPEAYMQLLPEELDKLQSDVTELIFGS